MKGNTWSQSRNSWQCVKKKYTPSLSGNVRSNLLFKEVGRKQNNDVWLSRSCSKKTRGPISLPVLAIGCSFFKPIHLFIWFSVCGGSLFISSVTCNTSFRRKSVKVWRNNKNVGWQPRTPSGKVTFGCEGETKAFPENKSSRHSPLRDLPYKRCWRELFIETTTTKWKHSKFRLRW